MLVGMSVYKCLEMVILGVCIHTLNKLMREWLYSHLFNMLFHPKAHELTSKSMQRLVYESELENIVIKSYIYLQIVTHRVKNFAACMMLRD